MSESKYVADMISDQLEKILSEYLSSAGCIENSDHSGMNSELWSTLYELGIFDVLAVSETGEAMVNWSDALGLFRVLGRHAVPLPIAESMIAQWLLSVAQIPLASPKIAVCDEIHKLDGNELIIDNQSIVYNLAEAEYLLGLASEDDNLFVVVSKADQLLGEQVEPLTGEPATLLQQAKVAYVEKSPAPIECQFGLKPLLAIARVAQMSGVAEAVLNLLIEYVNTREQFGRTIGKFQVIQHYLAAVASESAAVQVAAQYGLRQIEQKNPDKGAKISKCRAGKSAQIIAETAHQVFGAIGFTEEHELHRYTKRLWQWRSDYGSDLFWAESLGKERISAGGDALWDYVVHS